MFELHGGGVITNVTVGLGQGNDIFDATGEMVGAISGRINLGAGNDSTYFGGRDLGSGGLFANSTIYGGAGATTFSVMPLLVVALQVVSLLNISPTASPLSVPSTPLLSTWLVPEPTTSLRAWCNWNTFTSVLALPTQIDPLL